MPFTDLADHIQQQFAAFSGYGDEAEAQLVLWCYRQRAAHADMIADWRRRHPDRQPAYTASWRAKKPADECSQCKEKRVDGKKVCQTHLEADRQRAARRYAATKARREGAERKAA